MTEEELEQKVDDYARTKEKLYKEPYSGCIPTTYTIICNSYIDGAKSRDLEIEELKSRLYRLNTYISQIKVLMNENIHCEEIYHHLECFLGMFEADEYDCECCHSEKCNKRLFFETAKEK